MAAAQAATVAAAVVVVNPHYLNNRLNLPAVRFLAGRRFFYSSHLRNLAAWDRFAASITFLMKKSSSVKIIVYFLAGAALTAGGYHYGRQSALLAQHGPVSKSAVSTAGFKGVKISAAKLTSDNQSTLEDFLKMKGKPDAVDLAAWVRGLSPEECAAAISALQAKPAGNPRDAILDAIVKSWAGRDPQGFLSVADGMTSPRMREQGVDAALKALATQDPQAALKWLKDNAGTGSLANQQARYNALIAGYAVTDPAAAFALVSALAEDTPANQRQKTQALQAFVGGLADQGRFSDALAFAGTLADGPMKNQALTALAQNWAQTAPADAAAWIGTLTDPAMRNNLSAQLVASWAGTDPLAAAVWAAQADGQSAGTQNSNLLASLVNNWASYDLDAVGTYLNSMPASSEKDGAIASFALNAATQDPEGTMTWVSKVTDEAMRQRLAMVAALQWQSVNPEGASQFLASTNLLTDEQKNMLANVPPFVTDMLSGNGGPGGPGGGPGGGGFGGPGGRGGPGPAAPTGGTATSSGVAQQVLNFVVSGNGPNILTGGGPGGRGGRGGGG
jgi:hypothetical protein